MSAHSDYQDTVNSSLQSLQRSLEVARQTESLLFSPESAKTGGTGSTEERHCASLSLLGSMAARSEPSSNAGGQELEDALSSSHSQALHGSGRPPLIESFLGRAHQSSPSSSMSESSWSEFSVASPLKAKSSGRLSPSLGDSCQGMEPGGEGSSEAGSMKAHVKQEGSLNEPCLDIDAGAGADIPRWLRQLDPPEIHQDFVSLSGSQSLEIRRLSGSASDEPMDTLPCDASSSSQLMFQTRNNDEKPAVSMESVLVESALSNRVMEQEQHKSTKDHATAPLNLWKPFALTLAFGWLLSTAVQYKSLIRRILEDKYLAGTSRPATLTQNVTTIIVEDFKPPQSLAPNVTLPATALLLSSTLVVIHVLLQLRRQASPKLERVRYASPLLELTPSSVDKARVILPAAISAYHDGQLEDAIKQLLSVVELSCAKSDKVSALEYLGRAQYRLARVTGSQSTMDSAAQHFERAIRLDSKNATARGSLGRAKYRLGRHSEAIRHLLGAVKRDEGLSYAHEYLGKSYVAVGVETNWPIARDHLEKACALDPQNYSARAFLGEQLHLHSELRAAGQYLQSAVSLRSDYSTAHARLAFIALEQLDHERAARHFDLVLATRESGFIDTDMNAHTRAATTSWFPYVSLLLALPTNDIPARLEILDRALIRYPTEVTLVLLRAITLRHSQRTPIKAAVASLRELEDRLRKRVERFGAEGDVEAKGLWSLALLGLNRNREAERVQHDFWTEARRVVVASQGGQAKEAGLCRRLTLLEAVYHNLKLTRYSGKVKKENP